jgi:hypothetical protein
MATQRCTFFEGGVAYFLLFFADRYVLFLDGLTFQKLKKVNTEVCGVRCVPSPKK